MRPTTCSDWRILWVGFSLVVSPCKAYRIVCGGSLDDVAKTLNLTSGVLVDANPDVEDPQLLWPGQPITIPTGETNYTALAVAQEHLSIALAANINSKCLAEAQAGELSDLDAIIDIPDSCGAFSLPTEVTVNAVTVLVVASDRTGESAAAPATCALGLGLCNVIDPTRLEAPWKGSMDAFPQCFDLSLYSCLENFLCPINAPKVPGQYACDIYQTSTSTHIAISGSTARSDTSNTGIPHTSESTGVSSGAGSHTSLSTNSGIVLTSGLGSLTASSGSTSATPIPGNSEIVLDGTTYTINPTSSVTITDGGQTIVLGTGGVQLGSSVLAFPTGPTTVVVGSQTITFDRPTSTRDSNPGSSEIVLDGSTYTINPTSLITITDGGQTIVLGSGGFQIGSSTLPIPVGPTTIAIGSQSFTFDRPTSTRTTSLAETTSSPRTQSASSTGQSSGGSSSGSQSRSVKSTLTSSTSSTTESEVVIGGTEYPIETSAYTVVDDNSQTWVIGGPSGGIVLGSHTISFPADLNTLTTITTDGVTATLGASANPVISNVYPTTYPIAGSQSQIVIGGKTIPIPATPTTIVQGSSTFVISSGEVIVGTQTVDLPSGATGGTTITSGDATITLGPVTSPPPPVTAYSSQIIIDGSTYLIGTLASTVVDQGTTYTIGGPDGQVVVGADTINLPTAVDEPTIIVTDGVTLTLGPSIPTSIDPIGDLESLKPDVGILAGLLGSLVAIGAGLSAGTVTDAAAITQLDALLGPLDAGIGSLYAAASHLPALGSGLSYPPEGFRKFDDLRKTRNPSFDLEAAINKLLRLFRVNQTYAQRQALIKAIENAKYLILPALIAYLAWVFSDESTSMTSISTSTSSSSSSSTTSSEMYKPTEWLVSTKAGTSLTAFKLMILALPDHGTGDQITFPNLDYQGYVTSMDMKEAAATNLLPIVDFVWINNLMDAPESYISNIRGEGELYDLAENSTLHKRILPAPTEIVRQSGSFDHLKLMSQSPADVAAGQLRDYSYDPSVARDEVTLYILDRGFNINHRDFRLTPPARSFVTRKDRRIDWTAANALNDDPIQEAQYLNEPHGTSVASVAVGHVLGVLKDHFEWVPVKWKAHRGGFPAALYECWSWMLDDVVAKGRQRRAVINYSGAVENFLAGIAPQYMGTNMFEFFLERANEREVVIVEAGGNSDLENLNHYSPLQYGGPASSLIIVGGTNPDGTLWPLNRQPGQTIGGFSLWTLASQVRTASAQFLSAYTIRDGTSFGSPAIAGLVAYYLSFPDLRNDFIASTTGPALGRYCREVKNYLIQHAFPRAQQGAAGPIVPWNQAVPGPQCPIRVTVPLRRQAPTPAPQLMIKRDVTLDDWDYSTSTIVSDGTVIATDVGSCSATSATPTTLHTSTTSRVTTAKPASTSTTSKATTSSRTSTSTRTVRAITMTFDPPAVEPTCQNPGLRQYRSTMGVSLPSGAPALFIELPIADIAGSWEVDLGGPSDASKDVSHWQVKTNVQGPLLSSGNSGDNKYTWTNPDAEQGTELELLMQSDLGIEIFAVTVTGRANCAVPTPPPTTTAPPPSGPTTTCDEDCLAIIPQLSIYGDLICTGDDFDKFLDSGTTTDPNGEADWFRISSHNNCYLVMAKSAHHRGFPDQYCFRKDALISYVQANALGCNFGDGFNRVSGAQAAQSQFTGQGEVCLTNFLHYQECGYPDL